MQNFEFSDFNISFGQFHPFRALPRVADGKRTVHMNAHAQHGAKFGNIFGNGDCKIGDGSKIGKIEDPLVRLPVPSRHARTVDAEDDGQILRADVVNDLVIGALQERRIDGIIRAHPGSRKRRGKHGGMFFADADVERPLGKPFKKPAKTEAVRHRSRHGDDAAVRLRQCRQLFAERTGILRPAARADAVRLCGSALRKRMAVSLARMDVKKHAPLFKGMFRPLQRGKQLAHIVPVDDTHIGEPEMFEKPHVLFGNGGLAPIPPRGVRAPLDGTGIFDAFPHLFEDRRHAPDRLGNRHPVIVQNDEDARI